MLNPTLINDIVSTTMQNRQAKLAEAIARGTAFGSPKPLPWPKRMWQRLVDAWPLQWKRDDDGDYQ